MNTPVDSLQDKFYLSHQKLKDGLFEFLFRPASETLISKAGNYLVLGVAYLGGVIHWAWLINYGNVKNRLIDWPMFYDFYQGTQNALIEKSIPYFMQYFYRGTNQFLAIPETDLSPIVFLLKYLSIEDFFLTQLLIMYSLGFIGCLWFKKRYQWSLFTFVFFFLIFNLNGHIVSHLAVGHWPWISYFLLPFFIAWVLRLAEGEVSLLHGTRLAWILFVMLLFGGLHPFVWCLIFLFVMCLFQKSYWRPILTGVSLALIFSTYQILPAAITFWGYQNPFMTGFPSLSVFLSALVKIYPSPEEMQALSFSEGHPMPWWEVDYYITILGLGFLLYFGLWRRWRVTEGLRNYQVLNMPMLVITIFSFSTVFGWISNLPIPLISVERVPSRFLIIPILILLVLSSICMQRMIDSMRPNWSVQILAIAGLFYEGVFLVMHSLIWYEEASAAFISPETLRGRDAISEWAKSVEQYYIPAVQISYLISLIALLAFVAGSLYYKKKRLVSGNKV